MKRYKFYHCENCNSLGKVEVVSLDAVITQYVDWVSVSKEGGEVDYKDKVEIHERYEPRYQCFYCGTAIPVSDDDELIEWMKENGVEII